jgi:predicted SAM-dependent methyltransferase
MATAYMHIDDPVDHCIVDVVTPINGWISIPVSSATSLCHELRTSLGSSPFRCAFYPRQDLSPDAATGFTAYLDLRMFERVSSIEICIGLESGDYSSILLTIDYKAWEKLELSLAWHAAKKMRILSILKSSNLGASFVSTNPINALPADWPVDYRIETKKDPVSSHYYGPKIENFLSDLPSNSTILDIGAGLRRIPWPNVVNCEIYDYPSTDILCLGSDLPIKDNSVDAVLSLAVLEHVPNPFFCAAEIQRVLKPGGKAYIMMPFLQAEHGYPNHYFNATRQGVIELFPDLKCLNQFIDLSNHPIMTCAQILQIYLETISPEHREDWLSMPIRDIFSLASMLSDSTVGVHPMLPPVGENSWHIAWGTTSIFEKMDKPLLSK